MCEKNGLHICHSRSPVTLIDKNTSHINRVVMKWFGVFSLPFFPFSLEVEPLLPVNTILRIPAKCRMQYTEPDGKEVNFSFY